MRTWIVIVGIAFSLSGCEYDNAPRCNPRAVAECACENGGEGRKTCKADGSEFQACLCLEAGVPADAPELPDAP
jgi:hypothetical protein